MEGGMGFALLADTLQSSPESLIQEGGGSDACLWSGADPLSSASSSGL